MLAVERTINACGYVPPPPFEVFAFVTKEELEKIGIVDPACQEYWLNMWKNGMVNQMNMKEIMENHEGMNSVHWMDMYVSHDDSVGNDLLVELFCSVDGFPGGTHSCQAAKKDEFKGDVMANSRHRVDLIVLAFKAKWNGLLSTEQLDAAFIRRFLINMETLDLSKYPTSCMSQEKLDKLHIVSWEFETICFPERKGPLNELYYSKHREAFRLAVSKGKFCSLDTDVVVNDEEMKTNFKSWYS